MNSEEIEKLIYENRFLKLELQKIKSKNDFYVDSKLFEENINVNASAILSNNMDNPSPSVKSMNNNHKLCQSATQDNRYGEMLNAQDENSKELNLDNKAKNINSNFQDNINNQSNNSLIAKNKNNFANEKFLNHNLDPGNNINEIINNLMLNNNADSISELSSKKNTVSYRENIGEHSLSNKKSSAYNSLFKAGESLIGGQYSTINKSINLEKRNRSPDFMALKQVNDRLRYLENLGKESSKVLNKQREKIKFEKVKKEEEMKKKIEDVFIILLLIKY